MFYSSNVVFVECKYSSTNTINQLKYEFLFIELIFGVGVTFWSFKRI